MYLDSIHNMQMYTQHTTDMDLLICVNFMVGFLAHLSYAQDEL